MIKAWVIKASSHPTCYIKYGAYAETNPYLDDLIDEDFYCEASQDLWDAFGYLEDDRYDDIDENYEDSLDEAYESFAEDVDFYCYEDTDNEVEGLQIIYDERESES